MLPDKYRPCQDKVGVDLEVIGGTGVVGGRMERWKSRERGGRRKVGKSQQPHPAARFVRHELSRE